MLQEDLSVTGARCYKSRPGAGVRLSKLPRLEKPRILRLNRGSILKPSGFNRHVVLMVKTPTAGRVKTRLARGAGLTRATTFYRFTTNSVLSRLGNSQQWRTYLAISPDNALSSRAWPLRAGCNDILRFSQGRGDLGRRMQRVFDGMPAGPVVIIGSDIPAISNRHIAKAFRELGRNDAVFGPSPDGGYWLFGMRRIPKVHQAFEGVRWSTPQTLDDTLQNFQGLKVMRLNELKDVDEAADLVAMSSTALRRVLPAVAGR